MSVEMMDDLGGPEMPSGSSRKRLSGKKLVLFGIILVALLAAAGAFFMFGGVDGIMHMVKGDSGASETAPAPGKGPIQVTYYDLPDILVNLRTDSARPTFLKLTVSLELERPEDRADVDRLLPRVIDTFQVYLRELRAEQLQGSAGLFRLREELLARVNAAVRPTRVNDVLFKEMLVQ
jgi:flagellar FliL protein